MEGKKKLALTFAFYQGDQLVRRETVVQDIVKVGKDAKSHLRVDDEQASRMHAVIEVQDDVTLIDLGNEAGTMVNGARVNKCKLSAGDQIQIGGTLIVLEKMEEAAAGPGCLPAGDHLGNRTKALLSRKEGSVDEDFFRPLVRHDSLPDVSTICSAEAAKMATRAEAGWRSSRKDRHAGQSANRAVDGGKMRSSSRLVMVGQTTATARPSKRRANPARSANGR